MSEELKSAFEIPGFLEGRTKIRNTEGVVYSIDEGVVFVWQRCGTKDKSSISTTALLEKIWTPVPEKKKRYRHHYLYMGSYCEDGEIYYQKILESAVPWQDTEMSQLNKTHKWIKTEEVE